MANTRSGDEFEKRNSGKRRNQMNQLHSKITCIFFVMLATILHRLKRISYLHSRRKAEDVSFVTVTIILIGMGLFIKEARQILKSI